jgi:hypothetical protein
MNLFLESMDTKKVSEINQTKANKEFALRLYKDLSSVFHIVPQIDDDRNYCSIHMMVNSQRTISSGAQFKATKDGIVFIKSLLAYYSVSKNNTHIMPLGGLYERYKDSGTTCQDSFIKKDYGHGQVHFKIPISRHGDNKQILKDIVTIMEQEGYNKKF